MSVDSSRAPRWTRRKEARPGELLDAALELFVERGFASTRLDEVAARAGVAKGTLYLYFASKEELFKAVVRQNIVPLINSDKVTPEVEEALNAVSEALTTENLTEALARVQVDKEDPKTVAQEFLEENGVI